MRRPAAKQGEVGSVSVVIVNFNAGGTLPRCLEAVRAQSLKADRVIVVDNASTDGSIENAKELFPECTYVCLSENIGFAAANNRAFEQCDSEFVALLNPDAFAEPSWLEELVEAARKMPDAASFGSCQLMAGNAEMLDGTEDVCHLSGLVWRNGHGRLRDDSDMVAREIFSPCAAAALYRLKAIRDAGGFDEDFFCYVEDVDLGFRLRLLGWRSWYVPTAVVHHVGSATTGGSHSTFAVYHGHRNLVWMFVKNMPGYAFWLSLPLHVAVNIAGVVRFALGGQRKNILRSKRDALLGLRRAWCKRKAIQDRRTVSTSDILSVLNTKFLLRCR